MSEAIGARCDAPTGIVRIDDAKRHKPGQQMPDRPVKQGEIVTEPRAARALLGRADFTAVRGTEPIDRDVALGELEELIDADDRKTRELQAVAEAAWLAEQAASAAGRG